MKNGTEEPYSNWMKLYFLGLAVLGLVLLYFALQNRYQQQHPPPNPNPYIDEIYKGK